MLTVWSAIAEIFLTVRSQVKFMQKVNNCQILMKCSFPKYLTIALFQQTITRYKIRHAGGQAHYYSRTGTLKQRDLNQSSLTSLCFNVPVRE